MGTMVCKDTDTGNTAESPWAGTAWAKASMMDCTGAVPEVVSVDEYNGLDRSNELPPNTGV